MDWSSLRGSMHPRGGGWTTDLGEVAVRRRGALNPHSHLWLWAEWMETSHAVQLWEIWLIQSSKALLTFACFSSNLLTFICIVWVEKCAATRRRSCINLRHWQLQRNGSYFGSFSKYFGSKSGNTSALNRFISIHLTLEERKQTKYSDVIEIEIKQMMDYKCITQMCIKQRRFYFRIKVKGVAWMQL